MANTARAYSYSQTQPSRRPQQAPQVRVVPGRGGQEELSPMIIALVKVAMVALVVFALAGCVRIAFASATVTTSVEAENISTQISEARSQGSNLEVKESSVDNPATVKAAAAGMGFAAATQTDAITLPKDVVATDASGNLSLSKSMTIAAQG